MNVKVPKNNGAAMLKQVQDMQAKMAEKQTELENAEYTVSAGGGMVTVTINGKHEIKALDIKPEIVDPDDIETLSDILTAALNEAVHKVDDTTAEEMGKVTGALGMGGIPGLPGGLF